MVSLIWKDQQWPQERKRSVFLPIPKKGNAKECSNYCTIVLISHDSFPGGWDSKESTCNVGHLVLIPGLGRSSGEGSGNPIQYLHLENPHGQRSLPGYSPWGCKGSDTTERLSTWHNTHASRVMLEIPQARLQQYVNRELADVQVRFRKGRGTRDQIAQSIGS